jgi:branched-subunit amino acid transport protein AzlD
VKPVDWVVLLIAFCVVFVVSMTMLDFFITGVRNSPENSKLIAKLVASMIVIISIYVGSKLKDKDE